jgi:hypothetical protein
MNVGPSHAAGSRPSPEPDLPGEFVSEDLRNDCARFLHEQRRLVGLRRELTPEKAAWLPARVSDPACPDLLAESPDGAAAQLPPNSRSTQAGQ